MSSEQNMMDRIMAKAMEDERIRTVFLTGSRANGNAVKDQYSDFDIVYFVKDVREFTKDKSWVGCFGEILIVQYPDDWYQHPYDYNSQNNFTYLIQFEDGNRLDLKIVDWSNREKEAKNQEPRIILLNKDSENDWKPIQSERAYWIQKPSEKEVFDTINEFRWLVIYITKGLLREEFYYAKYCYDVLVMSQFIKMLNWKIGIEHQFQVTTGVYSKYLKRYLSKEEMQRVQELFPNGAYHDIWNRLFLLYDYFEELAFLVSEYFNVDYKEQESRSVRKFLEKRRSEQSEKETGTIKL